MNHIHHSLVGKKIRSFCTRCGQTRKSKEVDPQDLHAITVATKAFDHKHAGCEEPAPEPEPEIEPKPEIEVQRARVLTPKPAPLPPAAQTQSGSAHIDPALPAKAAEMMPAAPAPSGAASITSSMGPAMPARAAEMSEAGKVEQIGFVRGQTVVSALGAETKVVEHPAEP